MATHHLDDEPQKAVGGASPLTACPECDLLQKLPPLAPGGRLRCVRCRCELASRPSGHADLSLALTCTAAVAYLLANLIPLMDLSVVGRFASTTIAGGAYEMWLEGQTITAVLVAFCAVIAPGFYILFALVLLLAARRSPVPQWVGEMLRWVHHLQIWSMVEVMLLGILVALVKIAELATVTPGMGLYAMGALVLLIPAIMRTLDVDAVWQRVRWVDGEGLPRGVAGQELTR
jgi:paraquat-inducible protein A